MLILGAKGCLAGFFHELLSIFLLAVSFSSTLRLTSYLQLFHSISFLSLLFFLFLGYLTIPQTLPFPILIFLVHFVVFIRFVKFTEFPMFFPKLSAIHCFPKFSAPDSTNSFNSKTKCLLFYVRLLFRQFFLIN